jgi:hypothetical protein
MDVALMVECVVDRQAAAVAPRHARECRQVDHLEHQRSRTFRVDQARLQANPGLNIGAVGPVKIMRDALAREQPLQRFQNCSAPGKTIYDLGELCRCHRRYQGLMAHWRRVLPGRDWP